MPRSTTQPPASRHGIWWLSGIVLTIIAMAVAVFFVTARAEAVLGFVLYLDDAATGAPINHAPRPAFETAEACAADLETLKRIAPEWLGTCREEEK